MPDVITSKHNHQQDRLTHPTNRPWLLAGGWLLFVLGLIGIALPLLPTTVFWIGAVWCWSRSAPHLTRRILSHPRFGQPVSLFIEKGQMSKSGKWMALGGMAAGFTLLLLINQPGWPISLLLGLTLALIALWLWQRPEPSISSYDSSESLTFSKVKKTISSANLQRDND
jgi:uncharacterized membrane protein YbaN (DUF454 family)